MTRKNQYQPLEVDEAQGSQPSPRSEDMDSIITSRLKELLSNQGVLNVAARYDGRAGIASRRCLEVKEDHFAYQARLENKSQRTFIEKPML